MTDLVPIGTDACFTLAERICRSALLPAAYRGKPVDAAIAMLYGAEVGLPPMTALQRIVVINGRPTLDAQGLTSLIRRAGHSIVGDVSPTAATIKGKRGDTGDEMTVTWTIEDAQRAGLIRGSDTPWHKFPSDMLWARAVSQLGRRLFSDVLLGLSYVPEEMEEVAQTVADDTGEIIDATAVDPELEPPADPVPLTPKQELAELIKARPLGEQGELRAALIAKFGASRNLAQSKVLDALDFVRAWAPGPQPRSAVRPPPDVPPEPPLWQDEDF